MEKEIFKGKWNQIKGSLKIMWSDLTDDEIGRLEGDYDKTVGYIQEKYGMAKSEVREKINGFLKENKKEKKVK